MTHNRFTNRSSLISVVTTFAFHALSIPFARAYEIIDMHPPQFTMNQSAIYDMHAGQQVGFIFAASLSPAIWTGTPQSAVVLQRGVSIARGVHNGIQVGGGSGSLGEGAFVAAGTLQSLMELPSPALTTTVAEEISAEQIVGWGIAVPLLPKVRAYLWNDPQQQPIDLTPMQSNVERALAFGVENGRQVGEVRFRENQSIVAHAALWTGTAESFVDLNPPGSVSSAANAIGDGRIVGHSAVAGAQRATIWTGPTADTAVILHSDGFLATVAEATANGIVVGHGTLDPFQRPRAMAWLPDGTFINLHPPGATESQALAIDEFGNIGGQIDGKAAIWIGVPEPTLAPLVAVIACALTARRRSRRQ